MFMRNIFKIVLLVGSSSLACSASALYLEPDMPAVEIAVEYELEEFSQPANFQKSDTGRIDGKDHTLTMVAQKNPIERTPIPVPKPRPAPIEPRIKF